MLDRQTLIRPSNQTTCADAQGGRLQIGTLAGFASELVAGFVGIRMLAYNMKRMIQIMGGQPLIAAIRT